MAVTFGVCQGGRLLLMVPWKVGIPKFINSWCTSFILPFLTACILFLPGLLEHSQYSRLDRRYFSYHSG